MSVAGDAADNRSDGALLEDGLALDGCRQQEGQAPMKRPIIIATLFLATTAALPASAHAPTGRSFYMHQGYSSNAAAAYAADPRNAYAAVPFRQPAAANPWGHCVSGGLPGDFLSAYPNWDVCPGN
jgi:hypothetical protein